jgi:acyl-CoA hydrolase
VHGDGKSSHHILTGSPLRDLDSALMAKDKSEKKKKRVSDVVPAAVEEDVEMVESKVSSDYGFRQREVMQDQVCQVSEEGKGRNRDCNFSRGSLANSASSRSKEAFEKTSENNQKGSDAIVISVSSVP